MTLNDLIPSFSDFIIACGEAKTGKDTATYLMFEMLENPDRYNNASTIKALLRGHIDMDAYIHITYKLKL